MNYDFLPEKISKILLSLKTDKLNELRLREGHAVILKYDFKNCYLTESGVSFNCDNAIIATREDIKSILANVTERSMYAHNERLKQGYLSYCDGIRIGVAGECVVDNVVIAIKNIKSILVRFPCKSKELANDIKRIVYNNGELYNTLIISPPGFGKTTLIKQIIKFLSKIKNVLVIDERGELFDKSVSADYIRYSKKDYAFEKGIRVLSPEVVVTDELMDENDLLTCKKVINSGIYIIATMHGKDLDEGLIQKSIFDKYIILNNKEKPSEIKCIYDRHNHIINE